MKLLQEWNIYNLNQRRMYEKGRVSKEDEKRQVHLGAVVDQGQNQEDVGATRPRRGLLPQGRCEAGV